MTFDENEPMDALDRLIADAARDYNTPPPTVPRDAMWTAIVAARASQAGSPTPVATLVTPVTRARAGFASRWRGHLAVAAAAAIFLATGVGIGRWWGRGDDVGSAAPSASAPRVATAQPAQSGQSAPAGAAPIDSAAPSTAPASSSGASTVDAQRATQVATQVATAARRTPLGVPTSAGTDPYDVTMARHFAQAEALLVSYRADTVGVGTDRRLAAWARPLLADTRLLLDSPAATDPRRRRLLEDLELVLAQFARLGATAGDTTAGAAATTRERGERQLIDGSIRRAQILPRLRTLVPTGT